MKRNVRYLLFLLFVPLLAACDQPTDASLSFTDVPIRVNTSVEGGGSTYTVGDEEAWVGEELPAKLFFWHEGDFKTLKNTSETNAPTPYFTYLMNDAITSFSFADSRWLDTGHPYPKNTDNTEAPVVYATGYAPRTLLTEDATLGFKKLTVTGGVNLQKVAHCDFLSCDARSEQKGSFEHPFGNTVNNELQFRHLTSKILVYASRHETITGQVYVRRVKATLTLNNMNNKFHVPSVIEWKAPVSGVNTEWGYQVTEYKKLENGLTFQDNTDDMIMVLQDKRIDSCYVCQPADVTTTAVDLSVTAEYSYLQDFSSPYEFKWSGTNLPIKAIDNDGQATDDATITAFKPGYVYEIYLKFYKTGVIVTAREVEWEDGGIHYVPVYPPGNSSDDAPSGT